MSINVLMAATNCGVKPVTPIVGMGATQFVGSDRYPYFVKEVISPKKVVLQAANAVRTDKNGFSETQVWEITPNPGGSEVTATMRKNGRWLAVGDSIKGVPFLLGHADRYNDPSF